MELIATKRLLVKYREQKMIGGVCGSAMTEPFHLVSLKLMEQPIEFILVE